MDIETFRNTEKKTPTEDKTTAPKTYGGDIDPTPYLVHDVGQYETESAEATESSSLDLAQSLIESYAHGLEQNWLEMGDENDRNAAMELRKMVRDARLPGRQGIKHLDKLVDYFEGTVNTQIHVTGTFAQEKDADFNARLQALNALRQEREVRMKDILDNANTRDVTEAEAGIPRETHIENKLVEPETLRHLEQSEMYDKESRQAQQLARIARELPKLATFDPEQVQEFFVTEIGRMCKREDDEIVSILSRFNTLDAQANALGISEDARSLFETLRQAQVNVRTVGEEQTKIFLETRLREKYGIEPVNVSQESKYNELIKQHVDIVAVEKTDNPALDKTVKEIHTGGYHIPQYIRKNMRGDPLPAADKDIGVRPRVTMYKSEG